MKYFVLLFVFLLFINNVFSQSYASKENYVWTFGAYEGLDFNKKPLEDRASIAFNHFAIGSVCDSSGKLQFYTEGTNVYLANGSPMLHGLDITPGTYTVYGDIWTPTEQSTHGVQIIPVPGSSSKYYIFSVVGYWERMRYGWVYYLGKLYYSMVDMSLNGGLGDVVPGQRGILLDSNVAMPLAGVVADQCNTYWLLAHDRYLNHFKAYNITDTGVSRTPVISQTGNQGIFDYGYGAIVASPNRHKIAISAEPNDAELFDFDPATGVVSNAVTLQVGSQAPSAPAFSPDNTKLYYIYGAIYQFDLTSATPSMPTAVSSGGFLYPDLRLGPDGKIYVQPHFSLAGGTPNGNLGRIEFPNRAGTACQYNVGFLPFRYGYSIDPFPSEVPVWRWKYEHVNSISSAVFCPGTSVVLNATNTDGIQYKWNDGSTDKSRVADTTGIYFLTYTDSLACTYFADTFKVKELDSIKPDLGADTTICKAHTYLLQGNMPDASYLWPDGSKSNTYEIDASGTYWIQVTSKDGCIGTDSIRVRFISLSQHLGGDTVVCQAEPIRLTLRANVPAGANALWNNGSMMPAITIADTGTYWVNVSYGDACEEGDTVHVTGKSCNCAVGVPSAFSPNGDGHNDLYRAVLQMGCPIDNYLLNIYNRWGQLVFTSYSPQQGWDGTFNGVACDIGTYSYALHVTIGDDQKEVFKKGDIQLIR